MRIPLILLALLLSVPAFAEGIPIAPSPIAPSADGIIWHDSAFGGGRFLTVWSHMPHAGAEHIYGAFSDAEGRRLSTSSFTVVADVNADLLNLIGVGDSFVLFWVAEDRSLRMTPIDRDGGASPSITLDIPSPSLFDAAWNGTHFALAVRRIGPGGMYWINEVFLLDAAGERVTNAIVLEQSAQVNVLPTQTGFIALVVSNRGLRAVRLGIEGIIQETLVGSASSAIATELDDGSVQVFFISRRAQSRPYHPLYTAVVSRDGSVSEPRPIGNASRLISTASVAGGARLFLYPSGEKPTELSSLKVDPAGNIVETADLHLPFVVSRLTIHGGDVALGAADDARFRWGRPLSTIAIRAGALQEPFVIALTPSNQSTPLLVPVGGVPLAAWFEHNADGPTTRRTFLDSEGRSQSPVVDLPHATTLLVSNGSTALMLMARDNNIVGIQLDGQGRETSETIITSGLTRSAVALAAVWTGSHYLVMWITPVRPPDDAEIYTAVLTPAGTASAPRLLEIVKPRDSPRPVFSGTPQLAFDGERVLFLWTHGYLPEWPTFAAAYPTVALAARLDAFGSPLDPAATLVDREWPQTLSLATSGDGFVLISTDLRGGGLIRGTALSADGPAIGVERSRILFEAAREPRASVVWTGEEYAVAISHQVLTNHLVVKYLDGQLAETKLARSARSPARGAVHPTSVATGDRRILIGYSEPRSGHHLEAVIYRDEDMNLFPPPPRPPAFAQVGDINHYEAAVTWEPGPGASPDGFSIEVRIAEHITVYVVGPDVRTARIYRYDGGHVVVRSLNAAGASDPTPALPLARRRATGH